MLPTLSRDPSFARMMVSEARLSALLHHPAMVQVQDFGEVGAAAPAGYTPLNQAGCN